MDNTNTYCVYIHRNKKNGKVYIGQTIYGDKPNKRWLNGRGYQINSHFYNAIQKYGWDKFEHFILMSNLTVEEANYYEQEFIKLYDACNPDKGYNITTGGYNYTIPTETLKERRKKQNFEDKIAQFDLHGNLIAIWDSPMDIKEELGINYSRISICCRKENFYTVGYHSYWRKCGDIIQHNGFANIDVIPRRFCQIIKFKGNNDFEIYNNIKEASKKTGLKIRNIQAVCAGEINTLKEANKDKYKWYIMVCPLVLQFIDIYGLEKLTGYSLIEIKEKMYKQMEYSVLRDG